MSEDIPPKETTQEENNNHEENQNVAEEVATSQQPAPAPAPAPAEEEELETEKVEPIEEDKEELPHQETNVPEVGNDLVQEDPHTSFLQPPSDKQQFATPSKDLPALKDIETITTPKTFDVAKDNDIDDDATKGLADIVASSPIKHNILAELQQHEESLNEDTLRIISGYLSLDESSIKSIGDANVLHALVSKSAEFQNISSENEFLKLKMEQNAQSISKQLQELQQKYSNADNLSTSLQESKDKLEYENKRQTEKILELEAANDRIQRELADLKQSEIVKDEELNKFREGQTHQLLEFEQQINQLSSTNVTQSKKLNELTKEINETRNDKFSLQLELTKSQNEASYLRDQKDWYDNELKSAQARFTELIKKHESEFLGTSTKVSNLTAKNETLETLNKQHEATIASLKSKLEQQITKASKTETEFELEKSRFLKEIDSKQELIELTKLQAQQRATRIEQLESYSEEIKQSMSETITSLETALSEKNEKLLETQERLKRTEEALDAELHKETDLPKLSDSSAMIAANGSGISLSTLYSEYNHLKKQLVVERSQKQKMEMQLESFINELDARKPVIANYREQIQFYENSMKEMLGKVETIRSEKGEVEKDAKRLRSRVAENENELVSMKRLLKDLGRQLCFYLIHSKIRDNSENPLTAAEKKSIEKILSQTGNFDEENETDSDKLISERLLEFKNIIELQQRNEELLVAIRQLSKKLEAREEENNNLESVAIEEAKDAILTLESELDSLNIKLDAVTKERDALRSINVKNPTSSKDSDYLSQTNADLRKRLGDSERIISEIREQSAKSVYELNEKIRQITDKKNELALQVSVSSKSTELAETRLSISQKSLSDCREELALVRKEIEFWREQTSKFESQLVSKTQQLHEFEETLSQNKVTIVSLEREKEFQTSINTTLESKIEALKNDKIKLNEFVLNLQSMLKDREESARDISGKLSASIENYQNLQQKLSEKEERIFILSNQSELSLKAQNTKLEQVNEISRQLLETKNKLIEKENVVEELKRKLATTRRESILQPTIAAGSGGGTASTGATSITDSNNFEIQQLKEDLRIAESQVEELSNLAKASEATLIDSTNSFEQYKADSESKYQALLKEKELVDDEVKRLTDLYNITSQDLQSAKTLHIEEVNELKLKLNEFKYKADQYDTMENDYQEKIESIRRDLDDQTKLYNDCHTKYQAELNKTGTLTEHIGALKTQLEEKGEQINSLQEEVKTVQNSIKEQQDQLVTEKSQIETDLSLSNNRIAELKEQNDILLNQLELTKNSLTNGGDVSSPGESGDDLRQVVNYLRREKESSDAKLLVATEENQELTIKLRQVQNELATTKSVFSSAAHIDLDAVSKEQKNLSAQLEQLNLLRESNSSLRQENVKFSGEIKKLNEQIITLGNELNPLKEQINELTTNLEFEQQKAKLLHEENERIKLAALSTDEQKSDANKHTNETIARMQEQMDKLKTKANERIRSMNETIASKDETIKQLNEKVDQLSNSANTNEDKSKEQIDQLNTKLSNLQSEVENSKTEKNELLKKLSELESNLRAEFDKEKQEIIKSLELAKQANASDENLQKKYKELEEALTNSKKEFETKLETERKKTREEVEKKYDIKLKMMNRKIEKYEKANNSSTPTTPLATTPQPSIPAKPVFPVANATPSPQVAPTTSTTPAVIANKPAEQLQQQQQHHQPTNNAAATPVIGSNSSASATPPPVVLSNSGVGSSAAVPDPDTKTQSKAPVATAAASASAPAPTVSRPVGHPGNESTLRIHRPGGHPGFESTLTVHKPTVTNRNENRKFSPVPNPTAQDNSKKRTNEGQHQRPQIKKPKDS